MVKILVVTHGKMADGIRDAVSLILGNTDNLSIESLLAGEDIDDLKNRIKKVIEGTKGEGTLIFADLFGASPFNASAYIYQELNAKHSIRIISGVNLPMVMEALMNSEQDIDTLVTTCIQTGKEAIQDGTAILKMVED